jgi:tetratricopeptide (TPR) repeat protein
MVNLPPRFLWHGLCLIDSIIFKGLIFMMKNIALTISGLLISGLAFGQTLQEAIKKTENERMEAAAGDFRSLIAKDASKGEYYFYFGENYFKNGDIDSANMMYNKGVEVNATNPLNYVGLGKVLLSKGDINAAKTQFYKAASIGGPKNAEVMRQTAEAWLTTDRKEPDAAMALLAVANKLESKNPEGYILLGDAQLEKNPTDGSAPILSYQKASSLDPKNPKGILRQGRLYQRARNYNLALDYYKKAIELDPKFAPAYRQIAELYSLAGQHKNSIDNWKKYLELNDSEQARYRFMSALFFNKQYPEAIAEYENLKKSNFSNVYLERLAAYSYAEQTAKDSLAAQKGFTAMDNFFRMAGPNFK